MGVEDRDEIRNWQKRKSQFWRKFFYYSALAMIPVVILLLMVLIAHLSLIAVLKLSGMPGVLC